MNWLFAGLTALLITIALLWLFAFLTRSKRKEPTYRAEYVEDIPERLAPEKVYIAGESGFAWSAAMMCPCGCGKVLEMNLLPDARPVWKLHEAEDGAVSLHPSVWMKTGCCSHFFLTDGRIHWV